MQLPALLRRTDVTAAEIEEAQRLVSRRSFLGWTGALAAVGASAALAPKLLVPTRKRLVKIHWRIVSYGELKAEQVSLLNETDGVLSSYMPADSSASRSPAVGS